VDNRIADRQSLDLRGDRGDLRVNASSHCRWPTTRWPA
jgi:hypothetical protein